MQPGQTLVLVDGSSLAFRSFYALMTAGLRRADGKPTWAILGFFNSLFDVMEQRKPDGLAISFDVSAPTFRHEEFKEYKANRGEMPDDLAWQWPLLKHGVQLLGVPVYEIPGFEADDVIGTLTKQARERNIKVEILTGDYDTFQLVDDENDIRVLVPVPRRHELIVYGRKEVYEKLGVWPEQVIDYKGLCGDTSDNIPGVRGIGPKTAVELLSRFQTLAGIYEHVAEIKSESQRRKLTEGKENAFASQKLATIIKEVPLAFDFEHCSLRVPPVDAMAQFFTEMEFRQMVQRLPKILSRFGGGEEVHVPSFSSAKAAVKAAANATNAAVLAAEPGGSVATLVPPKIKIDGRLEPLLVTNQEQLKEIIRTIENSGALSLSLEASGSPRGAEIFGYALAWAPGLKVNEEGSIAFASDYSSSSWQVSTAYIPVSNAGNAEALSGSLVQEMLTPLLQNRSIAKIIHNSKLALNTLALPGSDVGVVTFDPMLASYIANPDDKHLLREMAERVLGYTSVRSQEQTGKKQLTINFSSLDKVASCAADDARIALELARHYIETMDDDDRYLFYEMDLPLSAVLARMEQTGVCLDLSYLSQLSKELTDKLLVLERRIYELANHPFNINSPPQLQKVLFEELGLKTKGRTKTGFSTDAAVLEALKSEHEIVGQILDYRHMSKLRSTYVDALPKQISAQDHRLHGEFNQTVTSTGRLSSSNPNLQNIPIKTELGRRIRRAFIPQNENHLLLSADYSQIELRLLAHMSGDETLIDAFTREQDIHARTSGEIFDVPVEQVTADMRRVGKTLNFALVYQQGPFATAQDLGVSTREASAFIQKYFNRYPRVRQFINKTIEEARENGYVSTLWGRRRYFRFLNDRSEVVRKADERAAVNAPIQGSAADLMKLAMIRLDKALRARNLQSQLILQVHDELVLDVPKQELDEVKKIVVDAMLMDQPLTVPLQVDTGVGPNWMEAK